MTFTRNLFLAVTAVLVVTLSACDVETTDGPNAADREASNSKKLTANKKQNKPKGPTLSNEQQQAVRKAEQYLDQQAFSKSGLIDQLKYEGFSKADATKAVNTIKVNWMNQAALKAKQYLDQQSFSRAGLIDQLKYEGFNQRQAEYGATQAGL